MGMGMDWQQIAALGVVGATGGIMLWSWWRRRRRSGGAGCGCAGCGAAGGLGPQAGLRWREAGGKADLKALPGCTRLRAKWR